MREAARAEDDKVGDGAEYVCVDQRLSGSSFSIQWPVKSKAPT
jgi:hypothetical protein